MKTPKVPYFNGIFQLKSYISALMTVECEDEKCFQYETTNNNDACCHLPCTSDTDSYNTENSNIDEDEQGEDM
jgi:hypothetical protein